MSKATDKLAKLMQNLKKLPANRRAYYLQKLKALEEIIKKIESTPLEADTDILDSQWMLDFANSLDKAYSYVSSGASSVPRQVENINLQLANQVDTLYNAIATEVAQIPATTGKVIGRLTGTGDYWPYVLGAAVALGTVYYVKNIA